MANPFELIAQRLSELGFFNFLIPFLITLAVFYGLLKKANLFSIGVNAVIAISISFLIWGFWVTTSVDIGGPLSKFFTQTSVIILLFLFAIVGASMFYPDFNKALEEIFRGGVMFWILFAIFAIIFLITSGLGSNVLGLGGLFGSSAGIMVVVLFFLFLGIVIASIVGGGQ